MDRWSAVLCVIFLISVTVLLGGECKETEIVYSNDTDQVTTNITTNTTEEDDDDSLDTDNNTTTEEDENDNEENEDSLDDTDNTRREEVSEIYVDTSSVLLPPNYNKYEIPALLWQKGKEVEALHFLIGFALFIRRVLDVDTKNEILTLDTDVALGWTDEKIHQHLQKMNYIDPNTKKEFRNRSLDPAFLEQIWKPDIFIDEMVGSDKEPLIGKLVTLKFHPKGAYFILFARRTLKLRCEMDFYSYPADIQTCTYNIRSYSHDEKSAQLIWLQNPQKSIPAVYLNDPTDANFDISLDSLQPSVNLDEREDIIIQETFNFFREANYSVLRFKMSVRRKLSYHVVQTYVPSVLLVLITWLCFILPYSMIEARIGISMTTLLTLTAMFSSIREISPDVSYTMAIDVWMVFCIFEVFLALLLFTSIYWLRRRNDPEQQPGKSDNDSAADHGQTLPPTEANYNGLMNFSQRFGFFAFASSFLVFFCAYWFYLLFSDRYLHFQTNSYFNNVGKLDSEPYQCYNKKIYHRGEYNKLTKCDEENW